LPIELGSRSDVEVNLTPSAVRNLPIVALAPSNCLAFLPAREGWTSTTPLPSVMMPEARSALRGRFRTFPQMSTDNASCQWSVDVGGVVFAWVVVVVVEAFSLATSRSWRLKTIKPRPTTQTTSTIVYHPKGVRCL